MKLDEAEALARSLVGRLGGVVPRVEVAGSVRRRKPEVKDIELVAIVDDYIGLYDRLRPAGRFIKPGVPDVVDWPPKSDARYVRMLLNEDIKLDLFIATPDNWGGIFTMRTGSAAGASGHPHSGFVPRLFARWKKVSGGGKMTGGQPTLPDGTALVVPEEEDFFALCQAQWVPPEERIDASAVRLRGADTQAAIETCAKARKGKDT